MKKHVMMLLAVASIISIQAFVLTDEPANKAALGKLLFFDPILSKDSSISCASCHRADHAFADTSAFSIGVNGSKGTRNTPSAMNVLLQRAFFWDGRAQTLEQQALKPIENPVEMDLPISEAVGRLQQSPLYSVYFKNIFNSEPTEQNLAAAIAAFERTLETSNSAFDQWKFRDKPDAVNDSVKRGFVIFNTKGKCIQCHFGANLASNEFRNIGLFDGKAFNDSGRIAVTGKPEDLGRFKIGPLRNVAVTAPYMHNGMFKTLDEVIDFYNETEKVVRHPLNKDTALARPLGLTPGEKADLKALGVTDDYIREIRDAGYKNISLDQLISFKAQGIDKNYLARIQKANLNNSRNSSSDDDEDNSSSRRSNNQDSRSNNRNNQINNGENVVEMKAENIVAFEALDIDDDYINSFREVGYTNISHNNIISMKAMGITPEYVRSFESVGYNNIPMHNIVAFKAQNVAPEFIRGFEPVGFREIPMDQVSALKALNVTPSYIANMREKGFNYNRIDKYIQLKAVTE